MIKITQLRALANKLNLEEIYYLEKALYERKKELYIQKGIKPLVNRELELICSYQRPEAIKAYMERLGCTLLEAKIAIDSIK